MLCDHCHMDKAIRNPSGYCDHLHYPECCEVCNKPNADRKRLEKAAPAMLEALKLCQVRLFMLEGSENEAYQQANAAINQAKGE